VQGARRPPAADDASAQQTEGPDVSHDNTDRRRFLLRR
jgi:hypothetical protein